MTASRRLIDEFANGSRRPLRFLGASGQLGYGVPTAPFEAGVARNPDLIGCDMGSIDIGPYYLGSGQMATSVESTRRDLRKVLVGARRIDRLLVIGSAGSAGAAPHLEQTLDLVRAIAREEGLQFRLGILPGDIDKAVVRNALRAGGLVGVDGMPDLDDREIDASTHLVAQMGMDAFQRAFEAGVDVLIAGRACDTAIFSALPAMLGFPAGVAVHMAKIIECASLCCLPGGRDTILATLDDQGFILESMAPQRCATPLSVSAHSLYEQGDPFSIVEPTGRADLTDARYEAIDERRTRVSGARWVPAAEPTLKLEGARHLGSRGVLLCGVADPLFIARRAEIQSGVSAIVRDLVCEDGSEDYQLHWRFYGVDAVAPTAPSAPPPGEAGLVVECIAPTPTRSLEVLKTLKQYLLHFGYPGRLSTGGNLAFPFTPPELLVGEAYRFNVYHIMKTPAYAAQFPLTIEDISRG